MGKVISLSVRRKHQSGQDPVVDAADAMLKALLKVGLDPAQQMVAIELVGKSVVEAVKHSRGLVEVNRVLLEAQHLAHSYSVSWPEDDQSPTVYDLPGEGDESKE